MNINKYINLVCVTSTKKKLVLFHPIKSDNIIIIGVYMCEFRCHLERGERINNVYYTKCPRCFGFGNFYTVKTTITIS